ncbi:MAG: 3-deoxy-8-phosphooctulonate synthase [Pyrinomonadaceae bacterium]
MSDDKYPSKPLKLDETAESVTPDLPAFLSRPEGSPVYHGFGLIEETGTDGWCFGAITEFEDPNGCESGDSFVIAPDGSRAGIVWEVGTGEIEEVLPPDEGRWGVYAVWFPRIVKTVDDLVSNFRHVLPELQKKYEEVKARRSKG